MFTPLARVTLRVTVKARVGRARHVAFRVDAEDGGRATRREVEDAFQAAAKEAAAPDPGKWRLTVFDGRRGLLRVPHTDADAARRVLPRVKTLRRRSAAVATLGTSGTIRQAKRRWIEAREGA